jgi:alcohol dehydrogenase (cytochrome c)
MTGSYDPQLDTVYWPVGNPGPDFDGSEREGDNLYTDSILALDAKTGRLKWHYQFTPHDVHDWDAQEPPVLVDTNWPISPGKSEPRKLLLQANRNGFFYVLDRTNGQLLLGKQFLRKLTWAEPVIGKDGRPVLKNLPKDANGDTYVCPGFQGGANWYSTSFNPATGFYYFSALERCNNFSPKHGEWQAGRGSMGRSRRELRKVPSGDQHPDWRDRFRCPPGDHGADGLGRCDVHGVRVGVLRREQWILHGRGCR